MIYGFLTLGEPLFMDLIKHTNTLQNYKKNMETFLKHIFVNPNIWKFESFGNSVYPTFRFFDSFGKLIFRRFWKRQAPENYEIRLNRISEIMDMKSVSIET